MIAIQESLIKDTGQDIDYGIEIGIKQEIGTTSWRPRVAQLERWRVEGDSDSEEEDSEGEEEDSDDETEIEGEHEIRLSCTVMQRIISRSADLELEIA